MKLLRTDEQTISDLELFGKKNGGGIIDIYNHVHTRGGETLLSEMFRHPLSDKQAINRRSSIIEHFARLNIRFPYHTSVFDTAEKYLSYTETEIKAKGNQVALGEKEIQSGVGAIIEVFRVTFSFMDQPELKRIDAYTEERESILKLITAPVFEPVLKESEKGRMSYSAVTAFDALFRVAQTDKVKQLLEAIYQLDVYMSVAKTAVERKFVFPKALEKGKAVLNLEGVYHPSLKKPVPNDLHMHDAKNVLFLTGANMAGKSTFLRSLSTALYIAHMGFPVAAASMEFSVLDGIYTTINLPDNLGIGASHFYVEVLRVKKMAQELDGDGSFFILFDELFRGTNVKDAHEATVAVIKGFARKRNSMFIVSSHIVEAGDQLQATNNIDFRYLPTRMNGNVPAYTYQLESGITDDRHGMIIIRNEGILDILATGKKESTQISTAHV
ncbi:MutS-related protein [Pseudobacter ginsenosidimutans]|uniref:MutS-like protein n=1 Tax=Pseudobacter ginsenosidimutans TaxID=661488 RepID=A0A4Q7MZU3_9BACT|nr:DNA mismatch repair protein [Pseudobacter ginsenosidimutans]QEC40537.1 DNA mismatch repair protein [Pseudobacter ginsenosidimutans]RZS72750.1 MutS-like protein [Pseudobacter ginsenosidimutans]